MHVHLRQHLHALQQNPLSALALYALLVWLSEGMGVRIMSSFDRPGFCNSSKLCLHGVVGSLLVPTMPDS